MAPSKIGCNCVADATRPAARNQLNGLGAYRNTSLLPASTSVGCGRHYVLLWALTPFCLRHGNVTHAYNVYFNYFNRRDFKPTGLNPFMITVRCWHMRFKGGVALL
jgi:hypothetical protein